MVRKKASLIAAISTMVAVSAALTLVVWPACAADGAEAELTYALVLSRHGVRSPTWETARLNEYSATAWPDWGVAPGELTPHGYAAVKLMGAWYREFFAAKKLFDAKGCRDTTRIFIHADTDQRTRETGRAFSESLLPGCEISVEVASGSKDPIFSGVIKADPELAGKAVRERLGPPDAVLAKYAPAFDTLKHILTGGGTARKDLMSLTPEAGKGDTGIPAPLSTASTFSEVFLLEYANGLTQSSLGWGRLTKEDLFQVLELHTAYADVARRTPYIARAGASNLLAHILASIEQASSGKPVAGAIGKQGGALAILAGHDTNLSNISGMLGLSWKLPGQVADDTPPESALIFSLWRARAGGEYFVKLEFVAPTLDQMRQLAPLTLASGPERVVLAIPGCSSPQADGGCTLRDFRAAMTKAIDPKFIDLR